MRRFSITLGLLFVALTSLVTLSLAVSITDIQGPAFLSPLNGQTVEGVQGIVTAKGTSGFWIQGPRSKDERVSNGVSVFTSSKTILAQVALGDFVSLNGKVSTNVTVLSSNNTVVPVVLGVDRIPPTGSYSALDVGSDGFFSVPGNSSQIETVNATLQPNKFGIDFFESLEGQLVTVTKPVAIDFENSFGEFWVRGHWLAPSVNSRGGLTITTGPNGLPNANPEVVIIGEPLDGTDNPSVAIGTTLDTITGVIQYQFGFYYILPLTAPTVVTIPTSTAKPTSLESVDNPCVVTLGDYNVDNLAPTSPTLDHIAAHIAQFLKTPDLVHVQEIQDSSGPTDDGTVNANVTLQTLVAAIKVASDGVEYAFVDVDPINDEDGGEQGGNIRQVYLYRPERIRLAGNSPVGGSLDATAVVVGPDKNLGLTFNPGRIQPNNSAWDDSRKSLAAVWERVGGSGELLFTVNVHHTAKTGGSSEQGNLRPPINEDVDKRAAQVELVADFVSSVLEKNREANVVVAGDFNEFVQTTSVFAAFKGILSEIDEVAGVDPVERYTYVFDMSTEQLDHVFISDAIKKRPTEIEHIHVNQWAPNIGARASDHDPSVARFRIC